MRFYIGCIQFCISLVLMASTLAVAGVDELVEKCPSSPNCVSSFNYSDSTKDERHVIKPLEYGQDLKGEVVYENLLSLLQSKHFKVTFSQYPNVKAEARSSIFKFIDVMEFVFNDVQHSIEIRSKSKTGYYDFGKNRSRMEEIRDDLIKINN